MQPKLRSQRAPGVARPLALATTAGAVCALIYAGSAAADVAPTVSVGAGLQTGFYSCDHACIYSSGTVTGTSSSVSGFELDSIRLYVNGGVTDNIKFTFNTEYQGGTNDVAVLDAIGRFEFNDYFNIWAGRFLPPTDRANLYGPYYANDWTPYADGVADYYPSVATGRDNGVAYWGDFGIAKVQFGLFDGASVHSAVSDPSKILVAERLTLDFWDKETGYYFNGTYYGDKNLLALGVAAQTLDSKTAWSLDGLLEKKLADAGAIDVEAEYQKDNGMVSTTPSNGWYGLVAYTFPQVVGIGKIQPLVKYSQKTYDFGESDKVKTTEVDVNYIIKEFNARVGLYYLTQKNDESSGSTPTEIGLKLQLQM